MSVYLPIAQQAVSLWILVGSGIVVGIVSGVFGVGGGFLITPILILCNVPTAIAAATGASLVVAGAVTSFPNLIAQKSIDFKLAGFLVIFGFIGSYLGVKVFSLLRVIGQLDGFIELLYVLLLGTIGILMLIESLVAFYAIEEKVRRISLPFTLPWQIYFPVSSLSVSLLALGFWGIFVGMLSAIMGVGGSTILIPILIYFFHVPMRMIVGTSTFQVCCVAIFSTLLQASYNHAVDGVLAFFLIIGGVIGAYYGHHLGRYLNATNLRFLFALLVLGVAVNLAINLFVYPDHVVTLVSTKG